MQHSPEKAARLQALREKMRDQHAKGETVALTEAFAPVALDETAPLLLTEADIVRAMGFPAEVIAEAADKAA